MPHTCLAMMRIWSVFRLDNREAHQVYARMLPVTRTACARHASVHPHGRGAWPAPPPPLPPPFTRAQSSLCLPPSGICQLMAGVPSQETTSRPLFICVSSEGLMGLDSLQALTVNGGPQSQRTTFLIARDACGHCANSDSSYYASRSEQGCILRLCEFSVLGS